MSLQLVHTLKVSCAYASWAHYINLNFVLYMHVTSERQSS
jgi:hypothetical protein